MARSRRRRRRGSAPPGWSVARGVLREVLEARGFGDDVGWIDSLGRGSSHQVWRAVVSWPPSGPGAEANLVVRLPLPPIDPDQPRAAEREGRLLTRLAELRPPWRLPTHVACVPLETGGTATVQRFVSGIRLDMRAKRAPVPPWRVIAEVAATCHRLEPTGVRELLPDPGTRRAHAEAARETLRRCDLPEFVEAHAWAGEHLPPATPTRLLHGDLLTHNLHLDLEDGPVGVIDWSEACLGDPAYELAVVTRCRPRPFQVSGGFERLLDAYNALAPEPVAPAHVRLHELCLAAGWYLQERESGVTKAHLEQSLGRLRSGLRRARASS